tara:strand:- start:8802 stop:10118 length:1317 start_codon:yes stop_codon:yes gene_type:complete
METKLPYPKYILTFICALLISSAFAQGIRLQKYSFGDGLHFEAKDDYSIKIVGYLQPFLDVTSFEDPTITTNAARFRMRRARLRLTGDDPQSRLSWRIQVDLSGTGEVETISPQFLMDAWVGYEFVDRWRIRLGQKNTPTDSRELLIRSQTLQLVERSRVTSAFSTIREFGIFIDGTVPLDGGMYLKPSLVLTNGDGLNVFGADFGGLKYGGRLDFLPFGLFTNMGQYHEVDIMRELVPRLVIGVAYSYNDRMSSRRGRESGAILYLNDKGEYSLPSFSKLGIDFLFKYKGFSAVGEFVYTTATVPTDITQRQRNDGSLASSFTVDGVEDVENYVKGRMMLGRGYNIQMGYLFKNRFSVDARYTHLSADEHSFLNNGTFYNRPNYYTLGISQYFSKNYGIKVQASVDYVEAEAGSNYIDSSPKEGNEWIFRLTTSFAF